jgi:hypothetical protein
MGAQLWSAVTSLIAHRYEGDISTALGIDRASEVARFVRNGRHLRLVRQCVRRASLEKKARNKYRSVTGNLRGVVGEETICALQDWFS